MSTDSKWLISRLDILDLIGRDTTLRKVASTRGGEHAGPCPFCGGHNRFRVQPERGRWWCRGCSEDEHWEDAAAYVMKRDKLSFPQALACLGGANIIALHRSRPAAAPPPPPDEPPSPIWQARAEAFVAYAQEQLWGPAGERALAYLREQRGLNDETIRSWGLGFNPRRLFDLPHRWGLEGKRVYLARGIVIPCRAAGQTWYVKVRRPLPGDELAGYIGADSGCDGKYLPPRGGRPALFGADTLHGRERAVLVEGEFDAMLLAQEAGDLVGVATLGSAAMRLSGRWIWSLAPLRYILAAYDLDKAGQVGARTLTALSARVRQVPPLEGKDLTIMHQAGGNLRAWVRYHLARAKPRSGGVLSLPPRYMSNRLEETMLACTPHLVETSAVLEPPHATELWDFDRHRWDPKMADLVAWFRRASFPDGPWDLGPATRIAEPEQFMLALWQDVKAGPAGARARNGALRADLARLRRHFGKG